MENNQKFPSQEAPEKNTDNAFVKVGDNGDPVIPLNDSKKTDSKGDDHPTTLDKR